MAAEHVAASTVIVATTSAPIKSDIEGRIHTYTGRTRLVLAKGEVKLS